MATDIDRIFEDHQKRVDAMYDRFTADWERERKIRNKKFHRFMMVWAGIVVALWSLIWLVNK